MPRQTEQRGPFQYEPGELGPNESRKYNFRKIERGRHLHYLPFDSVQVTNKNDSVWVHVTVNGLTEFSVPPNSVESLSNAIAEEVTLVNRDEAGTLDDGDVLLEVVSNPYDADERAREKAARGAARRVFSHLTGI